MGNKTFTYLSHFTHFIITTSILKPIFTILSPYIWIFKLLIIDFLISKWTRHYVKKRLKGYDSFRRLIVNLLI